MGLLRLCFPLPFLLFPPLKLLTTYMFSLLLRWYNSIISGSYLKTQVPAFLCSGGSGKWLDPRRVSVCPQSADFTLSGVISMNWVNLKARNPAVKYVKERKKRHVQKTLENIKGTLSQIIMSTHQNLILNYCKRKSQETYSNN